MRYFTALKILHRIEGTSPPLKVFHCHRNSLQRNRFTCENNIVSCGENVDVVQRVTNPFPSEIALSFPHEMLRSSEIFYPEEYSLSQMKKLHSRCKSFHHDAKVSSRCKSFITMKKFHHHEKVFIAMKKFHRREKALSQ
jgi:hypothetical protein